MNSNYGELEETHDTPPATSLDTDATDVLTLLCQEDVLTHPAVTAGEELETPHNTPPATLPATDVLTLLGLEDVLTHPAVTASDTESQICPVPGCEKRVHSDNYKLEFSDPLTCKSSSEPARPDCTLAKWPSQNHSAPSPMRARARARVFLNCIFLP